MEHPDAWIAATALYYRMPLVTHDEGFVHTPGLRLISASAEVNAARYQAPVHAMSMPTLDMRCRCSH